MALAFTPDGRLLVARRTGTLRIYKNGALLPTPALDLTAKLCDNDERGLLGVAVDPRFATNHFIYVYYTFKKFAGCLTSGSSVPVNRVSRFTLGNDDRVVAGSELVLIDNIPSSSGVHNAGGLRFGQDGNLYASSGDGHCRYGGSGCGPNNTAARDRYWLLGKILRITPAGGIPSDNPFQGTGTARCNVTGRTDVGKTCQEIWATGFRNPFRFAVDPNPGSTRIFIDDVGQATWEEVDAGKGGADYGWNVREGHCVRGSSTNCGAPPAGMTNPIWDYNHSTGCTAVTGAAFVPNGVWPGFDNAFLTADFICGKIWALRDAGGGSYTSSLFASGFSSGYAGIVDMTFGPFGSTQALYYATRTGGGEVHRLAYFGISNRPPTADGSVSKTFGPLPLQVTFDGTASSDPDNDALSYDWNFGDGSAHARTAVASHTYSTANTYTATLSVTDGHGGSDTVSFDIFAGDTPPTPKIGAPLPTKLFAVGEEITLHGSATDAQEGPLPDSALTWVVVRHHNPPGAPHVHPFLPPTSGNDIPIAGPLPEDMPSVSNSYLEIQLTATDSHGLSSTITQDLRPHIVNLGFDSNPAGLSLNVNEETVTTPATVPAWEGMALTVDAPTQALSGQGWGFASWSDGGAQQHDITAPGGDATYTATFTAVPGPTNNTPPTTSGIPEVGQKLTAATGDWTGSDPITFGLQWERCDSSGGSCIDIVGATLQTYTLTTADAGARIRVAVTATDGAGEAIQSSDATPIVAAAPVSPFFFDTFETGTLGAWTSLHGLKVQQQEVYRGLWAARSTTTGSAAWAYKQLSTTQPNVYVHVRFELLSRSSPSPVTLLRLRSGGSTPKLTLNLDSSGSLAYRNEVNGAVRTSSTAVTIGLWHDLQLHVSINGAASKVEVWYDGDKLSALSRTESLGTVWIGQVLLGEDTIGRSSDTAYDDLVVSGAFVSPPHEITAPSIAGTFEAGQQLTADPGRWTGNPAPAFDYQWLLCSSGGGNCSEIPGATRRTFVAATADVGSTLRVLVTGDNAAGTDSATSEATVPLDPGPASVAFFSDDFESGNLSSWSTVNRLQIQQTHVYAGTRAARATSGGLSAYAWKVLSPTRTDLYYRVRFKLLARGGGTMATLIGVRKVGARVLSLNIASTGVLSYRNHIASVTRTSTTAVTTNIWHTLELHVRINGTNGTVEVWYDGSQVAALSGTELLGSTALNRIQLGDDVAHTTYDVAFDDVAAATAYISG